ncbi:MAG: glycosyltransferase family 9 protein [Candidatus Omnitrophica bacterium]|nr:glycosyltransferase family 9 protein [Candidatus Omnitrophota bacterium]MCF7891885.1 glycosyltransferase family 9 protein [Candidatus Omnitrophota bacterium]MCF7897956.1 glycosyltransferase family 9 protein [Candidatus Omnitrophota bacterium]
MKENKFMKNIKKIVINFPTNIGDAVLALPALDRIKANFPKSKITAIVSPKTKDFISNNNFIDQVILFDKRWKVLGKIRFCLIFRKQFDLMVDFKNSMLPVFLGAKKRTPMIRFIPKNLHIKDKYLKIIKKYAPKPARQKSQFLISEAKMKKWNLSSQKKYVFFGCFSRSQRKGYPKENLILTVNKLQAKYNCVLLGLAEDRQKFNQDQLEPGVIDLVGKTDMAEAYFLLAHYAKAVVAVDSSIMHLSSYLDIPVVGLFGPTPPERSNPWSKKSVILQNKNLDCLPCEGQKECNQINCMDIEPKIIIKAVQKILENE